MGTDDGQRSQFNPLSMHLRVRVQRFQSHSLSLLYQFCHFSLRSPTLKSTYETTVDIPEADVNATVMYTHSPKPGHDYYFEPVSDISPQLLYHSQTYHLMFFAAYLSQLLWHWSFYSAPLVPHAYIHVLSCCCRCFFLTVCLSLIFSFCSVAAIRCCKAPQCSSYSRCRCNHRAHPSR